MPLVDWDGQAAFDANYSARGVVGYEAAMTYDGLHPPGTLYQGEAKHVVDVLVERYVALLGPAATGDRILIVGSALGYTVDALVAAGYANVVGIDNSTYIDAHPGRSTAKPFRKADMAQGAAIRNTIRSAFQDLGFTGNQRDPEWIITESVLESYDDVEAAVIVTACGVLCAGPDSQIVHVVMTTDTGPFTPPGVFNEKTLAEWALLGPTQRWMNYETGETI